MDPTKTIIQKCSLILFTILIETTFWEENYKYLASDKSPNDRPRR